MRKIEVLHKRVEAMEMLMPPKSSLSGLVERMPSELKEALLSMLKAEDPQEAFNRLSEKQRNAIMNLYASKGRDAVLTRIYMGSYDQKIRRIISRSQRDNRPR